MFFKFSTSVPVCLEKFWIYLSISIILFSISYLSELNYWYVLSMSLSFLRVFISFLSTLFSTALTKLSKLMISILFSNAEITLCRSLRSAFLAKRASISGLLAFLWRACATLYLLAFSFNLSSSSVILASITIWSYWISLFELAWVDFFCNSL